jgi:prepilin-type processing-associated H-X9-DG protein
MDLRMLSCPAARLQEAGCDFVCNPAILLWNISECFGTGSHFYNKQFVRPPKPNHVYPDNILIVDACELGFLPWQYSQQCKVGFDLDGGTLFNPLKPTRRYRNVAARYDNTPGLANGMPINPGLNNDSGARNGGFGSVRWRHGRNDSANFLFVDGTVRTMKITTGFGTPNVRGEVLRKYFRPKEPPNYRMQDQ